MKPREMLLEPMAYLAPARVLEGLTPDDAERRLPGINHSIAEIVAHLLFWQSWFCQRCEGTPAAMIVSAAQGWPAVEPGSWPELERRFVTGLERLVALGEQTGGLDAPLAPPIEFPPLAEYTMRDALVHVAKHNAHHLGQVIVLRQILGRWPPPAGSWTW
jgi:uncharacterized damage-inducible protein DinB